LSGTLFEAEGYEWATTGTARGNDDPSDRHDPKGSLLRDLIALAEHNPVMELTKRASEDPGFRPRSRPSSWHPKYAASSALWTVSPPTP
jgi:hypothetical protein